MSDVEIYLYANCSSCRQAEAMLKDTELVVIKRDLFKRPLDVNELSVLFERIGLAPSAMLSRRTVPFRRLDLGSKALSDGEIIEAMARHPALIRRPVIVSLTSSMVGFNRQKLASLIEEVEKGKTANA